MASSSSSSSSSKASRSILLKELRARAYGLKEAAWELTLATTRAVEQQLARRRWLPPASSIRIPSIWSGFSAGGGAGRGVSMVPRLLLFGLLVLQFVVFAALRSSSSPPSTSSSSSSLSSSPALISSLEPYSIRKAATRVTASTEAGGEAGEGSERILHQEVEPTEEDEEAANAGSLREQPEDSHALANAALKEEPNAGALSEQLEVQDAQAATEALAEEQQPMERNADDLVEKEEGEGVLSEVKEVELTQEPDWVNKVAEQDELLKQSEDTSVKNNQKDELKTTKARPGKKSRRRKNQVKNKDPGQIKEVVEGQKAEVEEKQAEEDQLDKQEQEEQQQQQQLAATEAAIIEEDPVCKGGRIFVYELPGMFNLDLLANCSSINPWVSLCDAFSNNGLGKPMTSTPWPSSALSEQPSWFYTEQFSGELIYHKRMESHPCTTKDSTAATAFYVPFYASLDVSRFLWKPSEAAERDALAGRLLAWLAEQPAWRRRSGKDHFMMIGRITWDFRREADKNWGSGFLHSPAMKNVTRLVIESNPWEGGEYGVPYPTAFHPSSDEQLSSWQSYVLSRQRTLLFSFAGATRQRIPNDFRLLLLAECAAARDTATNATALPAGCNAMDCSEGRCESPEPVLSLFLNTSFCLQPRGDSYSRRSIFDAAVTGCIPVFFWNQSSYWQYKWFFPEEDEAYSVFIDREDVRSGAKRVREVLASIPAAKVQRMREQLVSALPRLVYAAHGSKLSVPDAFDTAVDGVLRTMLRTNLREERQHQKQQQQQQAPKEPEEKQQIKKRKKKRKQPKNYD